MNSPALQKLSQRLTLGLSESKSQKLYKEERVISSAQASRIVLEGKKSTYLNFCANNYLGLSNNQHVQEAAKKTLSSHGCGVSSVRFICGTQDIHKQLEQAISRYHNREDTITYNSCFDANGGIFEALFGPEDAIFSDELNHASIIDGMRLCKASKYRYKHRDMNDLRRLLEATKDKRSRLIVTDGVFSMDGTVAPLKEIVDLASEYEALTLVDDCHATGFFGATGRGTEEFCNVMGQVTLINSTLGKALGGAAGGYTTGPHVVVDWLRQKSRPYLFSNAIPPSIVGSALSVFDIISKSFAPLEVLKRNTELFRTRMQENNFNVIGDSHPICPVMMPDEPTAVEFSKRLLEKGIYVVGFTYPVVPKGKARIRVQMSAAHTEDDVNQCVDSFIDVRNKLQTPV